MRIYLDWVTNQREDHFQAYSFHPNHSTVPWRSSTHPHMTDKGSATRDDHRPSDRRAHGPDSFDNAHISCLYTPHFGIYISFTLANHLSDCQDYTIGFSFCLALAVIDC